MKTDKPTFSRYAKEQYSRYSNIRQQIEGAAAMVIREKLSSEYLDKRIQDIKQYGKFQQLNGLYKERVHGLVEGWRAAIWQLVEFVYETPRGFAGTHSRTKFLRLNTAELHLAGTYRRGFVWIPTDDNTKDVRWYIPPKEPE